MFSFFVKRVLFAFFATLTVLQTSCNSGGGSQDNGTSKVETLTSIKVTPDRQEIGIKNTQQFTALGNYSGGKVVDLTNQVTWSSSDQTVAGIDRNGVATGKIQGQTKINAILGGIKSQDATLKVSPTTLNSITVTPVNSKVQINESLIFTAVGSYSDSSQKNITNQVTWQSSNVAVADINTKGVVIGKTLGNTIINATLGGVKSQNATLTVSKAKLNSITVTPKDPRIGINESLSFTAVGSYSDGSNLDITNQVSWSSSDKTVANIDNRGIAIVKSNGDTKIEATLGNISDSTSLIGFKLVSIAIKNKPTSILQNHEIKLTVEGAYSDSHTADITNQITWKSSDLSIIDVESGVISGKKITQKDQLVNIEASIGNLSDTVSLSVGLLIFVTDGEYNANLGGLEGGDKICNDNAKAQGFRGTYKFFIYPNNAIKVGASYFNAKGERIAVATSSQHLLDREMKWDVPDPEIEHPIALKNVIIWTFGYDPSGGGEAGCNNWTLASDIAETPIVMKPSEKGEPWWWAGNIFYKGVRYARDCNLKSHLYCAQQP